MFKYRTFRVGKMLPLSLILLAFVSGIWGYVKNQDLIMHQHAYFLPMYVNVAKYDLNQALRDMEPQDGSASGNPGHARSVPVLVYHGIRPKPEGENISISLFTQQMMALKKAGYQTISMQDFVDFMRHGKQLPAKSIMITFDDGRKDSYYPADPVLAALHFKAVMFVITRAVFVGPKSPFYQSKYYLSKSELATMRDSGRWDLQSHAAYGHFLYPIDAQGKTGHFYDNKLWVPSKNRLETDQEFATRINGDLKLAKNDLLQQLGVHAIAFAFPFSEFGATSINYPGGQNVLFNAVQKAYDFSFYQVWPSKGSTQNFPQDSSPLGKRILIDSSMSASSLMDQLTSSAAKPLPFSSPMTKATNAWLSTWGKFSWSSAGLSIKADSNTEGASMFLDGTRDWHNYLLSAGMKLKSGGWSRIFIRYQDDKNFASCTYTPDKIFMEYTINGETHELAAAQTNVPTANLTAQASVQNSRMQCGMNGKMLAGSNDLPSQLSFGGIGFEVWGNDLGQSEVDVSNVSVKPLP